MTPILHTFTALSWLFLIAVATVPDDAVAAVQQRQYQPSCNDCHKMPPIDAAYRNVTTGGFLGSHSTHNPATATAAACERCHGGSSGYTTGHMNDFVNMTTNINNSPHPSRATYNNLRFFNLTSNPVMESCSNVNCHFESTTPPWSTTPFSVPGSCGSCHGAPPADGSHPAVTGSGKKHGDYYTSTVSSCAKCHSDHTADAAPFAHATSVGRRGVTLGFTSAPNSGGSYSMPDNLAYPTYLPSKFSGTRNGSCNGLYCHSNGNGDAPNSLPVWGGTLPGDCTGCHGNDAASGALITSGRHRAHLDNYTTLGRENSFGCVSCHAATVGDNRTVSSVSRHVNGLKNYSGLRAGRILSPGTGQCSGNYCHSTGQKTASYWNMTSANWYSGRSLDCTGCHGNAPSPEFGPVAGAPNYPNGGAGTDTANSHKRHVAGAGMTTTTGCAKCHSRTVDGAAANKLRDYSTLHLNRSRDVGFSASASISGVQGRYSSTSQQCLNTYCHGAAPSARWGSTALACTACHSAESDAFTANGAGAHKFHYQVTTPPAPGTYASMPPGQGSAAGATSYQFTCTSCHASPATHAGGEAIPGTAAAQVFFGYSTAGMKGSYAYGTKQGTDNGFTWTGGTCSGTYCHSNGQGGAPLKTAFTWASPQGTLGCTGCHDTKQTGATPTALSGKHDRHMNQTGNAMIGAGNGFDCIDCHARTVSGNTAIGNKTNHVNRFVDFSSSRGGGSSSYDGATKQCTNIYCHSNGNPGAIVYRNPGPWTSGTSVGCNGCHGTSNPATGAPDYANGGAGTATANSHAKHVTAFGITDTTGCAACHVKTVNAATAGKFKDYSAAKYHLNGSPNVNLSPAYGGTFNSSNATCSGVSCHSNGRGAYQPVQWGTLSSCGLCHPIANLSATHAKHVNTSLLPVFYTVTGNHSTATTYDFGCSNCHLLTNPNHMNGTVVLDFRPGVAGAGTLRSKNSISITAYGTAGTADSGTTADSIPGSVVKCLNIYCHSNGYSANPVFATTPNWYGGAFTGDRCANCHGNAPNSTIAGSKSHYNTRFLGFTGTAGGHQIGIHAMGIYSSPSGLAVAGTGPRSSHGNPAIATTISCNICHYATVSTPRNDDNYVCRTCHYAGNGVGAQSGNPAAIADRSKHVNGTVDVAFKPVTILSRAQVRQKYFVTQAYSSVWRRDAGYKVAGSYDSAKAGLDTASMWDGTTKTCSNIACHNGNSVKWTDNGGTTECISCHGSL